VRDILFDVDDRIFFLYGSANRDEKHFERAEMFDIRRDTSKSIAFGAGPHFCAGAWASRAMVADVALPTIFSRLSNLRLANDEDLRFGGWAFRGLARLPVTFDRTVH
jgi:cytochrome P450